MNVLEINSHIPLFKNIFRTAVIEEYNGIIPSHIVERASKMIKMITEAEIRWTTYVTKGILGFSERTIKVFIENQSNEVCTNMGIPTLYEDYSNVDNPLRDKVREHVKGGNEKGDVETKTLFFEGNVADYSKASVKMDLDLDNINWDE